MIGPKELVDALVDVNWAKRFDSFSDEELGRLRLYDRLAIDLGERKFFDSPQALAFDNGKADIVHAGDDALRSVMMAFRQLWSAKEPARFERVSNLLGRRAKPPRDELDVAAVIDLVKERFKTGRRAVMMRDAAGDIHAERVIEDWLYSGQFHTDVDTARRVQAWSRSAYEWALIESVHGLIGPIWELHVIVRGALHVAVRAAA